MFVNLEMRHVAGVGTSSRVKAQRVVGGWHGSRHSVVAGVFGFQLPFIIDHWRSVEDRRRSVEVRFGNRGALESSVVRLLLASVLLLRQVQCVAALGFPDRVQLTSFEACCGGGGQFTGRPAFSVGGRVPPFAIVGCHVG